MVFHFLRYAITPRAGWKQRDLAGNRLSLDHMPSAVFYAQWVLNKYAMMIIMSLLANTAVCRYVCTDPILEEIGQCNWLCQKRKNPTSRINHRNYGPRQTQLLCGLFFFQFFFFSWSLHMWNGDPLDTCVNWSNYPQTRLAGSATVERSWKLPCFPSTLILDCSLPKHSHIHGQQGVGRSWGCSLQADFRSSWSQRTKLEGS